MTFTENGIILYDPLKIIRKAYFVTIAKALSKGCNLFELKLLS